MSKDGYLYLASVLALFGLISCSTSGKKQRLVQRDHLVATKKFYCEFLNSEKYPDMDVALNIFMAEKCDGQKPFAISHYRSASEVVGMMYCCNIAQQESEVAPRSVAPPVKRVVPEKSTPTVNAPGASTSSNNPAMNNSASGNTAPANSATTTNVNSSAQGSGSSVSGSTSSEETSGSSGGATAGTGADSSTGVGAQSKGQSGSLGGSSSSSAAPGANSKPAGKVIPPPPTTSPSN